MHALYKLITSETADGSINQSKCVARYAYPANNGKSITNREQSYQYGFVRVELRYENDRKARATSL